MSATLQLVHAVINNSRPEDVDISRLSKLLKHKLEGREEVYSALLESLVYDSQASTQRINNRILSIINANIAKHVPTPESVQQVQQALIRLQDKVDLSPQTQDTVKEVLMKIRMNLRGRVSSEVSSTFSNSPPRRSSETVTKPAVAKHRLLQTSEMFPKATTLAACLAYTEIVRAVDLSTLPEITTILSAITKDETRTLVHQLSSPERTKIKEAAEALLPWFCVWICNSMLWCPVISGVFIELMEDLDESRCIIAFRLYDQLLALVVKYLDSNDTPKHSIEQCYHILVSMIWYLTNHIEIAERVQIWCIAAESLFKILILEDKLNPRIMKLLPPLSVKYLFHYQEHYPEHFKSCASIWGWVAVERCWMQTRKNGIEELDPQMLRCIDGLSGIQHLMTNTRTLVALNSGLILMTEIIMLANGKTGKQNESLLVDCIRRKRSILPFDWMRRLSFHCADAYEEKLSARLFDSDQSDTCDRLVFDVVSKWCAGSRRKWKLHTTLRKILPELTSKKLTGDFVRKMLESGDADELQQGLNLLRHLSITHKDNEIIMEGIQEIMNDMTMSSDWQLRRAYIALAHQEVGTMLQEHADPVNIGAHISVRLLRLLGVGENHETVLLAALDLLCQLDSLVSATFPEPTQLSNNVYTVYLLSQSEPNPYLLHIDFGILVWLWDSLSPGDARSLVLKWMLAVVADSQEALDSIGGIRMIKSIALSKTERSVDANLASQFLLSKLVEKKDQALVQSIRKEQIRPHDLSNGIPPLSLVTRKFDELK